MVDVLLGILEQGFIYGILALGVYITYRILDFPDLSVDGTFPMGAAVAAILITNGINPWLALALAFAAGAVAGLVTGVIHVKCKVRDLLSGIITMTALYSINIHIAGGKSNLPIFNEDTIFNSGRGCYAANGFAALSDSTHKRFANYSVQVGDGLVFKHQVRISTLRCWG